jgi:hypothetical protein
VLSSESLCLSTLGVSTASISLCSSRGSLQWTVSPKRISRALAQVQVWICVSQSYFANRSKRPARRYSESEVKWCSDQDTWRRRTFFCLPVVRLVRSSSRYRLLDVYSDRSLAPPRMSNACSCSCALSDFNRLHASQHTFPGYRAAFPLSSASWHAPCIPNTSSSMARRPAIDRRI